MMITALAALTAATLPAAADPVRPLLEDLPPLPGEPAADGVPADGAVAEDPIAAFSIDVLLGVWLARPGGTIELSPGGSIDLEDDLGFRSQDAAPKLELALQHGSGYRVLLDVFQYKGDASGEFRGSADYGSISFDDGDPFHTELKMTAVALEVGIDLWQPVTGRPSGTGEPTSLILGVVGGLQYLEIRQVLEEVGVAREETREDWTSIYGGGSFRLRYAPDGGLVIARAAVLETTVAIGGAVTGDGGFLWLIRTGLRVEMTEHIDLMFGYRLVEADFDAGDFSFDSGLQGLYVGGAIRF